MGGNSRLTLPPQTRAVTPVNNPLPNNSAIPIQVPTPSGSGTQAGSVSAQVPVLGTLPVPNGNAPIGNAGNLGTVRIQATPGAQSPNNPPPPPTRGSAMGLSYRVVVDATTTAEQNRVRSLVPGAFRTTSNGRTVMQVGAFSDRIKADELLQSLNSRGVRARLEEY
uniref:SPOR domain-containing protein n=1 Tax=Desertifilum tharense IPPAS B-1220 TaxID=1781255 RepID=A0ACD5GU05_9CYAN